MILEGLGFLNNGVLWKKNPLKFQEVCWVEGIVILLHHFPFFCVDWKMLYRIGTIEEDDEQPRGLWTVGLWHLCWEGEMMHFWDWIWIWGEEGVPISMGALKRIIAAWTSRGLLGHICNWWLGLLWFLCKISWHLGGRWKGTYVLGIQVESFKMPQSNQWAQERGD